jgi:hypothetical protein
MASLVFVFIVAKMAMIGFSTLKRTSGKRYGIDKQVKQILAYPIVAAWNGRYARQMMAKELICAWHQIHCRTCTVGLVSCSSAAIRCPWQSFSTSAANSI